MAEANSSSPPSSLALPVRRKSSRPTSAPDRFVARPSRQGVSNADGDAMFTANTNSTTTKTKTTITTIGRKRKKELGEDTTTTTTTNIMMMEQQEQQQQQQQQEQRLRNMEDAAAATNTSSNSKPTTISMMMTTTTRRNRTTTKTTTSTTATTTTTTLGKQNEFMIRNNYKRRMSSVVTSTALKENDDDDDDDVEYLSSTTGNNTVSRYPKRVRVAASARSSYVKESDSSFDDDDDDDDDEDSSSDTSSTTTTTTTTTTIDDTLPRLDFLTYTPLSTKMCRAVSCDNKSQGSQGFCREHYSKYLMCTGQCISWKCACGNSNHGTAKSCHNCCRSLELTTNPTKDTTTTTTTTTSTTTMRMMSNTSQQPTSLLLGRSLTEEGCEGSELIDTDCPTTTNPTQQQQQQQQKVSNIKKNGNSTTLRQSAKSVAAAAAVAVVVPNKQLSVRKLNGSSTSSFPIDGTTTAHTSGIINRGITGNINTSYDHMLDFAVTTTARTSSSSPPHTMCRAVQCNKLSQASSNGFCRRHYNRYLVCSKQVSSWNCLDCGNVNADHLKLCNECHRAREGAVGRSGSKTKTSPVMMASLKGSPSRLFVASGGKVKTMDTTTSSPPEREDTFRMKTRSEPQKNSNEKTKNDDLQNNTKNNLEEPIQHSFVNVPEVVLLERTRHELLNGRDYWICIDCSVEVSSIMYPCQKCQKMISFVPLEIPEFEQFVQRLRTMNFAQKKNDGKVRR